MNDNLDIFGVVIIVIFVTIMVVVATLIITAPPCDKINYLPETGEWNITLDDGKQEFGKGIDSLIEKMKEMLDDPFKREDLVSATP